MSSENIFHETKDLPTNVLTLVDDLFYEFVEQRLGLYQSLLLKIQEINSVPCFLLINDPCEVLNLDIKDDNLNLLKKKICFSLSNGSFVVKPGFKTSFKCLRDLLSRKTEEKLKQSRNTKILSTTAAPVNIISSSLFSTPPMTTAPQTRTSSDPDIALKSIAEHRRYFFNLLKIWCSNHKDDFMSDSFDLKEGEDFILNVLYDQNNNLKISVKCNCNTSIGLTVKDEKIQLSNFQKHLRSTNCSHIRAIKKMNEEQKKINLQQSPDTLSSSTSMILKPSPPIQQPASLAPVSVSTGALSSMTIPSANTQTPALKTNSRKRGHSSSQVASSQKTKRNRSQTYASLLFQD
ncbi:unnamed protein product [Rotaria sordida]|uniref:Uncharacterized protein n=1 Tax=Rotaria sordida TaxID=392033 RepID=A0A819CGM5_9BILA|nr:unnamed protein product [Rotaria sordida]CAF3812146.1 unnamed protein product [Rotaria sordida]